MDRILRAEFRKNFQLLPNQITGFRLLCIPILWMFAIAGSPLIVGFGLMIAGSTDILDGALARKLNQITTFGSKLDTVVDHLMMQSMILWVLMLKPNIITNHLLLVSVSILLNLCSLLLGWLKFRRFGNLHLYSSKAAALAVYLFLAHAFILDYHPGFFYLTISIYILSSSEALLLQWMRSSIDEHVGTIYRVRPFRRYPHEVDQ